MAAGQTAGDSPGSGMTARRRRARSSPIGTQVRSSEWQSSSSTISPIPFAVAARNRYSVTPSVRSSGWLGRWGRRSCRPSLRASVRYCLALRTRSTSLALTLLASAGKLRERRAQITGQRAPERCGKLAARTIGRHPQLQVLRYPDVVHGCRCGRGFGLRGTKSGRCRVVVLVMWCSDRGRARCCRAAADPVFRRGAEDAGGSPAAALG